MTIGTWLKEATQKLETAGIGTARLDCLVLLEDITSTERTHLLAHSETKLSDERVRKLDRLIARRARHEPLAYIREKTEFYGREFMVNHHVLEPRPETETMIELLKELKVPPKALMIDVGTGSGAIAITAKLEFPRTDVIGVDISAECLEVARTNAEKLQAEVNFMLSHLLAEPILYSAPNIILANLPYVPNSYHINEAAMEEPRIAIFGGEDGLDLYREMFDQIDRLTAKPRYILTESLPFQHHALATIARAHGYTQDQKEDFIQLFVLRG